MNPDALSKNLFIAARAGFDNTSSYGTQEIF
jgi:hypothetical protein